MIRENYRKYFKIVAIYELNKKRVGDYDTLFFYLIKYVSF